MTKGQKLSVASPQLDGGKRTYPLAPWPIYWALTLCPFVASLLVPSCSLVPSGEHIIVVGSLAVGAVAACRLARLGPGRVFAGALCIFYSLCLAGWLIGYSVSFFKHLQS
jgi:hypothetical protein